MKNLKNNYITHDLKLSAFLRLMLPSSFIGVNKTDIRKVSFMFIDCPEITELVRGYFSGQQYIFSPLSYGNHIDQGKDLIFGNIEF